MQMKPTFTCRFIHRGQVSRKSHWNWSKKKQTEVVEGIGTRIRDQIAGGEFHYEPETYEDGSKSIITLVTVRADNKEELLKARKIMETYPGQVGLKGIAEGFAFWKFTNV